MKVKSRGMALAAALLFVLFGAGAAQALTVAAGAGYRRPVMDLAERFQAATGIKVDLVFGNMGQVLGQIRAGAPVDLVLGDLDFLQKSGLPLASVTQLGRGRLVLAHAKGVRLEAPKDLTRPDIKRLAIPDQAKAIYGKAGFQFLERAGLSQAVKKKLLVVATVPQVSTYLISREVDAGLLNLTDALGIKEKIGGYIEIEARFYDPIRIVAGMLSSAPLPAEAKRFQEYVAGPQARRIAEAHGL